MTSVWYVGPQTRRNISAGEWSAAGTTGTDVTWNKYNGYSVHDSAFTSAQLAILDADDGFWLGQADGPRAGVSIVPEPNLPITQAEFTEALAGIQAIFNAPEGIRKDADAPDSVDGEAHRFLFNSKGRLKVASMPGDYDAVTGVITGVGQTVVVDVGKASNVVMYVTGSFSGHNCTFEGSIDGGTTWFGLLAGRTNSATSEATSGALAAAPAYAWETSVNALTHIRIRSTAHTSGSATWRIQPGAYATEPVVTVGGTVLVSTSGTPTGTALSLVTAASTNLTAWRTSSLNFFEMTVFNPSAATVFVKLYNKASAPVVASDVPVVVIPVLAGQSYSVEYGRNGKRFSLGLGLAVTGAAAVTDATAVAAGVILHASYI